MQTCIWPSWCHCHSLSLASGKPRLVLPFWCWLTRVVPEKGPLNGCVCVLFNTIQEHDRQKERWMKTNKTKMLQQYCTLPHVIMIYYANWQHKLKHRYIKSQQNTRKWIQKYKHTVLQRHEQINQILNLLTTRCIFKTTDNTTMLCKHRYIFNQLFNITECSWKIKTLSKRYDWQRHGEMCDFPHILSLVMMQFQGKIWYQWHTACSKKFFKIISKVYFGDTQFKCSQMQYRNLSLNLE